MTVRPLISPHDQNATFVELFFDLVFVFGITQVVGLLHHGLSWTAAAQAVLVFWMIWWGWTQFTWALNASDTTHPVIEFSTLSATAIGILHGRGSTGCVRGRRTVVRRPLCRPSSGRAGPVYHSDVAKRGEPGVPSASLQRHRSVASRR